jgi:hypothetical protein
MDFEKCRAVIRSHVALQAVGSGGVIVDLRSGACFELNGVGMEIWRALSDGRTLTEVADLLGTHYDVASEILADDVLRLTKSLSDAGLIDVVDGAASPTA